MNYNNLLRNRLPPLTHIIAFMFVFLFFGSSVFAAGEKVSSILGTTLQIETDATFRRLASNNPILAKAVSSMEGMIKDVLDSSPVYAERGGGEEKETITSSSILSLWSEPLI